MPLLFVVVFLLRSLADFAQRLRLPAHRPRRHDRHPQRPLPAHPRPVEPLPRRAPVGRAGEPRHQRRGGDAERGLEPAARPLPAVGRPWSPCSLLLFSIHFKLALVCLVAAPVLLYPIVRFGKGMRQTSHRSQERMADLASLMSEGVARPPGGQGVRHGGVRARPLPRGDPRATCGSTSGADAREPRRARWSSRWPCSAPARS